MKHSKHYLGEKFGKLLVIESDGCYVYPCGKRKDPKFKCLCDCGNVVNVRRANLRSGNTMSCGCLLAEHASSMGKHYGRINASPRMVDTVEQFWSAYIKVYEKGARGRKHEWSLSRDAVINVASSNCHYCGAIPKPNLMTKNQYYAAAKKHNSAINEVYANSKVVNTNGLDRVNNNLGYTFDNVVPCCKICNFAKSTMNKDEFESWILRTAEHIKTRQKR